MRLRVGNRSEVPLTSAMKTKILKNKLCSIKFVKPLYKHVNETKIDIINTTKLDGHDHYVRRKVIEAGDNCIVKSVIFKPNANTSQLNLPGLCENKSVKPYGRVYKSFALGKSDKVRKISKGGNMLGLVGSSNQEELVTVIDKNVQAEVGTVVIHKLPDSWLRVHPASKLPDEGVCSVLLRCVFCQLGLIIILILWTVIWTFVIYAAEESFEIAVSEDFRKKQNKLVIDLATELRQIFFYMTKFCFHCLINTQFLMLWDDYKITPISEKWRLTIENRINHERELTISAVGRGARLEPGCFWSLAGTFLFNVYVMTALGFGAPVPQTLFGRTAALCYAILAVPTHIYLMVNLSTCIVARVDTCMSQLRTEDRDKALQSNHSKKTRLFRNKLRSVIRQLSFGHGIPLAALLYYTLGAVAFGVLRGNDTVDTLMYPLDFTTSGGLEHIEGYIRFFYGIFVEGAMVLLACALASLRRYSSGAIGHATSKYRLFVAEKCTQCVASRDHT